MSSAGRPELDWWGPGTVPPVASIVWCAFPEGLASDRPGPKARPGLIFKVRQAFDPPDNRFRVLVAYGTSNLKSNRRPMDFFITNFATRLMCDLPQGTRFDLDQVLWLPWARPFFLPREDNPGGSPVISTLPGELQRELGWLMHLRDQRGMNDAFKAG